MAGKVLPEARPRTCAPMNRRLVLDEGGCAGGSWWRLQWPCARSSSGVVWQLRCLPSRVAASAGGGRPEHQSVMYAQVQRPSTALTLPAGTRVSCEWGEPPAGEHRMLQDLRASSWKSRAGCWGRNAARGGVRETTAYELRPRRWPRAGTQGECHGAAGAWQVPALRGTR